MKKLLECWSYTKEFNPYIGRNLALLIIIDSLVGAILFLYGQGGLQ